jgi:hypothetical protein
VKCYHAKGIATILGRPIFGYKEKVVHDRKLDHAAMLKRDDTGKVEDYMRDKKGNIKKPTVVKVKPKGAK